MISKNHREKHKRQANLVGTKSARHRHTAHTAKVVQVAASSTTRAADTLTPDIVPSARVAATTRVARATLVSPISHVGSSFHLFATSSAQRSVVDVTVTLPALNPYGALSLPGPAVAVTSGVALTSVNHDLSQHTSLPASAIAGIVVGSLGVLIGFVSLFTFCVIRQRRRRAQERGWWAAGGLDGTRDSNRDDILTSKENLMNTDEHQSEKDMAQPQPDTLELKQSRVGLNDEGLPGQGSQSFWARAIGGFSGVGLGLSFRSQRKEMPSTVSEEPVSADGSPCTRPKIGVNAPGDDSGHVAVWPPRHSAQHSITGRLSDVAARPMVRRQSREPLEAGLVEQMILPGRGEAATSVRAHRRSDIRNLRISHPSLERTSTDYEALRRLSRASSAHSGTRSRSVSVSSSRPPLRSRNSNLPVAPTKANLAPLQPISQSRKQPIGLGLGHPTAQPHLVPAPGPSASRAPLRKLSPVLEVDSRNVSGASLNYDNFLNPPVGNEEGDSGRRADEVTRPITLPSSAAEMVSASPVKIRAPALKLPSLSAAGPRPPLAGDATPPLSPYINQSARRVSLVSIAPSLVARPPALANVGSRSESKDQPVESPASENGGAYGIGNAFLNGGFAYAGIAPEPSPSPPSTALLTPSPVFPTLSEMTVHKQDPAYKSATWSIYGHYYNDSTMSEHQAASVRRPSLALL